MFEASCLDFSLAGEEGISLASAWPVSDEEGRAGTGYVFTVTNNCDRDIDYIIGLESLEVEENPNYIDNQYLRIAIDDEVAKNLSSLNVIDNITSIGDSESIIETRQVITSTLKAYGSNEHVVKMWLSIDTPLSEQSKTFKSRIVVTGGQGIKNTSLKATADKCFTIDENGQITAYNIADSDCSENVVIPARVNDIKVKTIDTDAFRGTKKIYNYTYYVVLDSSYSPLYVTLLDLEKEAELLAWAEANGYSSLPYYKDGEQPTLESGQHVQYCTFDSSNNPQCGNLDETPGDLYTTSSSILITGLDLSKAIYLDTIEARAFTNVPVGVSSKEDFASAPISLTSLNFGDNDRPIEIGYAAFARISVKDLTMYAAYYPMEHTMEVLQDPTTYNFSYGFLTYAEIDNLTIKPSKTTTKISLTTIENVGEASLYALLNAKNIVVGEGITVIDDKVFSGRVGVIDYTGESLTLPNSLISIGESAFHNIPFNKVTIGSGITSIGAGAFQGMSSSQTITIKKADATGITLGNNWSGSAVVNYQP